LHQPFYGVLWLYLINLLFFNVFHGLIELGKGPNREELWLSTFL
jgi:hypothetical protein